MSKKIAKSILTKLEKTGAKFKIIDHRQVFTAHDKAATTGFGPKQTVKSVALKIDAKEYILASVPANKNVDLNKIKNFINKTKKKDDRKLAQKIDFAKPAWVKNNLKNSEAGALLPLGLIYNLPNLFDNSLLKQKFLLLNSGSNWHSIKITPAQLEKLEGRFLFGGSFSTPRPKLKKKSGKKK
ncbi:MAG: hypothetical protein COU85_02000 [Candidatus Portnoybacteria bacterium CG10_big_fil_rev_8_21_14_0_10_44_7]|uniref:YbaK/aminoacyl-tRNA synthetase-associated domain-containing protein n=1 Tax=Candidatus Portnoybacteria bacterium CG10_big_fil_rev_8_21_14_0_10_44_7 TaxID=1974816 RepID=A0A2M8KIL4_9BACT|nr:MAG: hypothetical protein COU85_02000 [Candidatus Portnoybacteria bacterium CG10_big_fil_rev_8_21_14_0_10_44_7]